jgi:hypothetical protein
MIVGGYSLHLYCDYVNAAHSSPGQFAAFFAETERVCWRQAREEGWRFRTRSGRRFTRCPLCVQAKITQIKNNGKGY